ncbi:MAG: HAD family hydrolase [Lachnospiraceae bacterium]
MYRCCIFDLDGTLLDTLNSLTYSVNQTLKHFGYPEVYQAHIKRFVGDGYKMLVERALKHSGDSGLIHYEEGLQVYREKFGMYSMHEVKPYDGIEDLLKGLKERGYKLAVLSNKPHAKTVENIEAIFGKGYFDYVAGERPEIPKKPDSAGIILIEDTLQVKPEECLYFGDTDTDMKTGTGAGLTTVGVTWGFRGREELESFNPQYVIDHPREVFETIL